MASLAKKIAGAACSAWKSATIAQKCTQRKSPSLFKLIYSDANGPEKTEAESSRVVKLAFAAAGLGVFLYSIKAEVHVASSATTGEPSRSSHGASADASEASETSGGPSASASASGVSPAAASAQSGALATPRLLSEDDFPALPSKKAQAPAPVLAGTPAPALGHRPKPRLSIDTNVLINLSDPSAGVGRELAQSNVKKDLLDNYELVISRTLAPEIRSRNLETFRRENRIKFFDPPTIDPSDAVKKIQQRAALLGPGWGFEDNEILDLCAYVDACASNLPHCTCDKDFVIRLADHHTLLSSVFKKKSIVAKPLHLIKPSNANPLKARYCPTEHDVLVKMRFLQVHQLRQV